MNVSKLDDLGESIGIKYYPFIRIVHFHIFYNYTILENTEYAAGDNDYQSWMQFL